MTNLPENDMTTGNVRRRLALFALPILLSNLLQAAYTLADMAVVGRWTGGAGLAAVANASLFSFILNATGMGLTIGGTVLIAQSKGAGDRPGQRAAARALLQVSTLAALLVTGLGLVAARPAFRLLDVPSASLDDACIYTYIVSAGAVAVFGYNAVCALLRGLGDARRPLRFVAVAAVLNVLLDLLLVGPLGLGVGGAAVATVTSQSVSLALAWRSLRGHAVFALRPGEDDAGASPDLGPVRRTILRLGLPFALQMLIINLGYLLVTGLLNRYGVTIAAASGIGFKICSFAVMPGWAVGQTLVTVVGQNMGAGAPDRAALAVRTAVRLNVVVTGLVVLSVNLGARPLLTLFSADPGVVTEGVRYLRICCSAGTVVYCVMYAYDSFLTGIGAPGLATGNALLDGTLIRLPLAWLLGTALGYGFLGVYAAQALSPLIPALAGWAWFCFGPWRGRRLIAPAPRSEEVRPTLTR